jgi:hypothetical protein
LPVFADRIQFDRALNPPARWQFVLLIFSGSFLLFLVQPMIARMALPRLGGAPAVWNSAMLVYQALLLGGYAFAHWLGRFEPRRQAWIQFAVLALAAVMLPIQLIGATPPPDGNAYFWVPWLLLVSIGPLFLFLSAQAPLVQRWFAASSLDDPYPLYAASNLGSFSGLLAYPLLAEPMLSVVTQSELWSFGYIAIVVLVGLTALRLPRVGPSDRTIGTVESKPDKRQIAIWVLLSAVPSGLMLSTTLHLTTDIVAMPLLWAIPLGLYLLSFTIAFATDRRAARWIGWCAPPLLAASAFGAFTGLTGLAYWIAGLMLAALFSVSVAIHSDLFARRPPPSQLTAFYLAMSAGGVLGGIFCALMAPLLFDWTYEHPLLLLAAAWVIGGRSPLARRAPGWTEFLASRRVTLWLATLFLLLATVPTQMAGKGLPNLPYAVAIALGVAALMVLGNRILFTVGVAGMMFAAGGAGKLAASLEPGRMTRSFFGVYAVGDVSGPARVIVHGTTVHGIQMLGSADRERAATSYYAPRSGVGIAMRAVPTLYGPDAQIHVVGLGAGTLACYARPGQHWKFFEIDPAVAVIARDPKRFRFLSRCLPHVAVAIGDARLTLAQEPAGRTDLLVVDAFSSDSVPMHLLTREALDSYRRQLTPDGLLMVHISNRFVSLEPVLAQAARRGWTAQARFFNPQKKERAARQAPSLWVAMSPSRRTIDQLVASSPGDGWRPLSNPVGSREWTDDYASIIPLLKW